MLDQTAASAFTDAAASGLPAGATVHLGDYTGSVNRVLKDPKFAKSYQVSVFIEPWRVVPIVRLTVIVAVNNLPDLSSDYRPLTGSPLIGAGVASASVGGITVTAPPADLTGAPWAPPNIGAYRTAG